MRYGPNIVTNGLVCSLDASEQTPNVGSVRFSNLISNPSLSSSYSANQNVTITQDGQYVKVVSNQNTSTPGAWPIGGIISVDSNAQYIFGIKAKVISNPIPYFYITGNNTGQILFTVTSLNSGSYTWSYITFNSTTNTTVRAGFLWSGPLIGSELSVETVMLSKFDTWYDLVGNNNGTLISGSSFDYLNNGSIVVDGANDYITINPINVSSQFTLNFCIKPVNPGISGSTSYGGIINKFNGVSTQQNRLLIDASSGGVFNKYLFQVVKGGVQTNISSSTFTSIKNKITLVTVTYDGSSINFYNNAVNVGSTSFTGNLDSGSTMPTIGWGANSADYYFNGNFYFCQFYNRALSDFEIQQNYNATKARFGLT